MPEVEMTPKDMPNAAWIRALYVDLLGEPPTPRHLNRWLTAARCGATHRDIGRAVLRTREYAGAQITFLYQTLLDRDPDPEGLEAWTTSLQSGTALQDIIASFCDTFEYKSRHPVASAFVESLYERLLRRGSDPDGKAARLAALRKRASTLSVIRTFLCSAEYCAQRVVEVHTRLLGREPGHREITERAVALMHGAPLQDLVLDLATSAEYLARTSDGAFRASPLGAPSDPCDSGASSTPAPASPPGAPSAEPRRIDPDQDVLDLVHRGNVKDAVELLMKRHGTAVYRYCSVALGDITLAEDVLQQIFIEAFRDLPDFAGRSKVRTWLLSIARHRVLDAAKQRKRVRAHYEDTDLVEPPAAGPAPSDALDDARLRAALIACVAELDEPVRTALLLRYQQGLTYEDMAEICGENAGTLQARVARALRRLRYRIEARAHRKR
jgi:RNA polymerase sigma-70 factor, ECF subfamily